MTAQGDVRVYLGSESQEPDPLVIASEGPADAPAYRGLAYVVFENLQLADFANRIPNLSFEVIADAAPQPLGAILQDLCAAAGVEVAPAGPEKPLSGLIAGRRAALSEWVESPGTLSPPRSGAVAGRVRVPDQGLVDRTAPR